MQRRRHRFPALAVSAGCQNATSGVTARPNVGAKRPAAAGWLGPVGENVPRTANRAKPACRCGSA